MKTRIERTPSFDEDILRALVEEKVKTAVRELEENLCQLKCLILGYVIHLLTAKKITVMNFALHFFAKTETNLLWTEKTCGLKMKSGFSVTTLNFLNTGSRKKD